MKNNIIEVQNVQINVTNFNEKDSEILPLNKRKILERK